MQMIEKMEVMEMGASPKAVAKGEGHVLELPGERIELSLGSADTNGTIGVAEITIEPGYGPPPHVHTQEDEVFIVHEGRIRFLVGERVVEAEAGTTLFAPRGLPHTFRGAGDGPARMTVMVLPPANMERFFSEYAPLIMATSPDIPRMVEVAARHGIEFLPSLEPIIA